MNLAELFSAGSSDVHAERLRAELRKHSTGWVEHLDRLMAKYLAVVRDELWRRAKAHDDPEAEIPTRPTGVKL